MAQFASENFNGVENTELSAHNAAWTKVTGVTGNAEIASSRLRQTNTTSAAYYHSSTPGSADYTVRADIYNPSGGYGTGAPGVIGRASTSANTFYHARNLGNGSRQLFKFVAGTATQLGSNSSGDVIPTSDSRALTLYMSGTTIEYRANDGSTVISATDSAISAAGKAGIRFLAGASVSDTVGPQLDNFSADDFGGGAAVGAVFRSRVIQGMVIR